jgi:hypothetical protein
VDPVPSISYMGDDCFGEEFLDCSTMLCPASRATQIAAILHGFPESTQALTEEDVAYTHHKTSTSVPIETLAGSFMCCVLCGCDS